MLWKSCVCISSSLDVICTSKAMAWFFSYQSSVLGLQLARMNLQKWPRVLNPFSIHAHSEYSCSHGARAGLHSIFISLPLWPGLCSLRSCLYETSLSSVFQSIVWRLVIVPGTFIYTQNSLKNRGLRTRSLAPLQSGIQLSPNSQHHVFLKETHFPV